MMVDIKLFLVFAILAAYFGPKLGVEAAANTCKCEGRGPVICVNGKQTCDKPANCFKRRTFSKKGTVPDTVGTVKAGCQFDGGSGTPGECVPVETGNNIGGECYCDTDDCTPPEPPVTPPPPTTTTPPADGSSAGSDGRMLRSSWSSLLLVLATSAIVVVPSFIGGQ